MTAPPRLLLALLLGVVLAGCGTARQTVGRSPSTGHMHRYLNDGDADHPGDSENDNNHDTDDDPSEDYKPDENGLYHERDDGTVVAYGVPASASQARAITSLVKRYLAAAAHGDGSTACALLVPSLARALPSEDGEGTGPSYLRGATTCAALMSRLFQHTRARADGFVVTGVRMDAHAHNAFALLGSRTAPASYISLQQEHDRWCVSQPVPVALP